MFTHHAEARMQQRGISHQAVDALMAYGEYRRHRGAAPVGAGAGAGAGTKFHRRAVRLERTLRSGRNRIRTCPTFFHVRETYCNRA